MDCRQIEQLLSPFIDGELTQSEAEAVRMHLSICADCGKEYETMAQLSAACKYISEVIVPAPAGFKDALMLRISDEENITARVRNGNWFNRNWKPAIAGIAAGVLLIIGTLTIHSGPVLQVAENPVSVTQSDNPSPGVSNQEPTLPTNSDSTEVQPPAATGQNNASDPVETPNVANNNTTSPMVLLNKDRFITTTLLKVKIADSANALQQAIHLAGVAKAQTQNLGQQVNEDGSYTLLKITVPKSAADGLIAGLSGLGTVTGKEVNNNDITTQYADKFSQYQSLVTQRATLQDASQASSLDQRIETIEDELRDWEQKSAVETIVLWLQK
jgi:Predicted transmembrane transcriptional regulator (anti-sigma factor)